MKGPKESTLRMGCPHDRKLDDRPLPMRGAPSSVRESSIEGSVVFVATAILAAALSALIASRLNIGALRYFVDLLALDGRAAILDGVSNARFVTVVWEIGIAATLVAAIMLAFRQRIGYFLLAPSIQTGKTSRIDWFEAVVAAFVVLAGITLAGRNLDLPMRGDEATSILNFGTKSLWVALSDYRSSNNHVLHSLLLWIAHQMGGWNPIALRMPAFLGACFTLPATWWFVRREYSPLAAVVATSLLATSPLFIEYATNARGYSLILLMFVLLLIVGETLTRWPDRYPLWALYATMIALGFLTIPIMAFPATIVVVWMLLVRWREGSVMRPFVARMTIWSVVALVLTLVLYTPVLTISGSEALFFNRYVQGSAWGDGDWQKVFIANVVNWIKWHWATPAWAQVALLVLCAVGVAAPRSSTGRRGVFPLAVLLGMVAVLSVKPVALSLRMTIFQMFAVLVIVSAGIAVLVNAASERMGLGRYRTQRRTVLALTSLSIFCLFTWWATRPGVAAWFASETGVSPNANALCAKAPHDFRVGDTILACWPTVGPLAFCLSASGYTLSRSAVDLGLPQMCRAFAVTGTAQEGRFFMFVDDAAYNASIPLTNQQTSLPFDGRMMRSHLEDSRYGYEVIARVDGGEIYLVEPESEMEE